MDNRTKVTTDNVETIGARFTHYDFSPLVERVKALEAVEEDLANKINQLEQSSAHVEELKAELEKRNAECNEYVEKLERIAETTGCEKEPAPA
jgi:peptidoglycan hydrolase CwlO-like protein